MKKIFTLFLLLTAFAALQAEVRIGVVDLEKIFREYYKSKIAEELIKQQAAVYRDHLRKLDSEHRALAEAARRAQAAAQNIAISAAERQKAQENARTTARAVAAKKAEAELYAKERAMDMRALQNRKRAEVLNDIQKQINRSAAVLGYGFVFDRSGRTSNGRGALLVYPPQRDFTKHVITELNRNQTKKKKNSGAK